MKKADKLLVANEIKSLVLFYSHMMVKISEGGNPKAYEMWANEAQRNLNDLGIPVKLSALD